MVETLTSSSLCQLDQDTYYHFSSLWKSRSSLSAYLGVTGDNFPNFFHGVFWCYHVDNIERCRCTVLDGNECYSFTYSHSMATMTMGSHLALFGCTAFFISIAQAKATGARDPTGNLLQCFLSFKPCLMSHPWLRKKKVILGQPLLPLEVRG